MRGSTETAVSACRSDAKRLTCPRLRRGKTRSAVCVYSFHPLVLKELERAFAECGASAQTHRLDVARLSDLASLPVPDSDVYILEANGRKRATELVVGEILTRRPDARLLVVAEDFEETCAFSLLRLGAKGFLRYGDLALLARAVEEVCAGGLWVARPLLSRFVETMLRPRRMVERRPSPREHEVHELLIQNLSNKEIAVRLGVSERTVKFHVSNLLTKSGAKKRADLILLSLYERKSA